MDMDITIKVRGKDLACKAAVHGEPNDNTPYAIIAHLDQARERMIEDLLYGGPIVHASETKDYADELDWARAVAAALANGRPTYSQIFGMPSRTTNRSPNFSQIPKSGLGDVSAMLAAVFGLQKGGVVHKPKPQPFQKHFLETVLGVPFGATRESADTWILDDVEDGDENVMTVDGVKFEAIPGNPGGTCHGCAFEGESIFICVSLPVNCHERTRKDGRYVRWQPALEVKVKPAPAPTAEVKPDAGIKATSENTFVYGGVMYEAVDSPHKESLCSGCAFDNVNCLFEGRPSCGNTLRSDGRSIIWVKVEAAPAPEVKPEASPEADENRLTFSGAEYVAAPSTFLCEGCEINRRAANCTALYPSCVPEKRQDGQNIIWVRAEAAPAPAAEPENTKQAEPPKVDGDEDRFNYEGAAYKAIEIDSGCVGCAFENVDCDVNLIPRPNCTPPFRKDGRSVVFVKA